MNPSCMRIGIEAQHIFKNKKQPNDFVALEFIRYLQEIDHVNEYFIFVRPAIDRCLGETSNFRIVDIPAAPSYIWEQVYLPEAALLEKCDVLHCTGIIAPVFSKVPIITTVHDVAMLERILFFEKGNTFPKKVDNVYVRYVLPKVFRKSKKIIAYSLTQRVKIAEYFKFEISKIIPVYKGIPEGYHRITDGECLAKNRKKYHLPDRFIFVIGVSGSMKEIRAIVSGFAGSFTNAAEPFMLVIVADMKTQLKVSSHYLADPSKAIIHFVKPPVPADLPSIYSMAEIVINVSNKEEAAYKMLEVMACETPVISITSDTISEIIGKAALITDIYNPSFLSSAINQLMNDARYTLNQLEVAKIQLTRYTWKEMTTKIIKIYEQVVANKQ